MEPQDNHNRKEQRKTNSIGLDSEGAETEPLLTVAAAARLLSVSESLLRHLIQRKQFPGVLRIRRSVRISARVLHNYVEELLDNARNY